ncbi:unnamed protein product [Clavelina lepadiformis]|uniref:Uncharacterized protein n=1 Tax=Clavelina lepadiformis TaxID=159417 RepID=A0ABP0H4H6_CLALP
MSVASGALTRRSVHPASPVLLTKRGPLGTRIRRPAPIKRIKLRQSASYPEGNFEGNQLLDGSISLSPLYPNLTIVCTSESLRSSTRVSSGFNLFRHSSPSFRVPTRTLSLDPSDKRIESAGDAPDSRGRRVSPPPDHAGIRLHYALRVSYSPAARAPVRLLGPCFKTGREGG